MGDAYKLAAKMKGLERLKYVKVYWVLDFLPFHSSSRAVAACQVNQPVKIATAAMSREISEINDYDGVTRIELRSSVTAAYI